MSRFKTAQPETFSDESATAAGKGGQTGYSIMRLHHALRRAFDDRLRDLGLNSAHYVLLRELADDQALSAADLARRVYVTPQAMGPIVSALEQRGLIERSPHRQHRRILQIRMTPQGYDLLAECGRRCDAVEQRLLAGLDSTERAGLQRILEYCLANMDPPWYEREASAEVVRRNTSAARKPTASQPATRARDKSRT